MLTIWDRIEIAIAVKRGEMQFRKEMAQYKKQKKSEAKYDDASDAQSCKNSTNHSADCDQGHNEKNVGKQDNHDNSQCGKYVFDAEQFVNERRRTYSADVYQDNGETPIYGTDGFDVYGFDRFLYNRQGLDRAKKTRKDYEKKYYDLLKRVDKAEQMLHKHEYRYSLTEVGMILEAVTIILLKHKFGSEALLSKTTLEEKQKRCERNGLLGNDPTFWNKLHEMRKIRNWYLHDNDDDIVEHNKVHFAVMTAKELVSWLGKQLDLSFS